MRPTSRYAGQTRSLAKALDTKVLSLVREYVEQQDSEEPTLQLKLSSIHTYVASDPSLSRHKKPTLEKSIERALDVIRDEGDDEELDSDLEGLEVGNLMVPDEKQSNAVNKRITDMWGVGADRNAPATPRAATPRASTPRASTPKAEKPLEVEAVIAAAVVVPPTPVAPGSPKRKRKEKTEEGRAKRAKGTCALGVCRRAC